MSTISVRRIEEEVLRQLKIKAAREGVSMEEEVRRILKRAVNAPERIGDLAVQMFGPTSGVDLELPEHTPHEPLDFTE
jgi:plasmid stability protein